MQANIKLIRSSLEERNQFKKKGLNYRSAIGFLNYFLQCTHPDITYAIGKLSQFLENPNETHWVAFKRVVQYLKGTQDLGIVYQKSQKTELIGYVDSSWATKSTGGY